jgi:hypothetical protein
MISRRAFVFTAIVGTIAIAYFIQARPKIQVIEVYRLAFETKPFPFWILIQILFCCHWVHEATIWRQYSNWAYLAKFFASFLMAVTPRELLAFAARKPSPICLHPSILIICPALFALFEFVPTDAVYEVCESVWALMAFFQGVNQIRLCLIALRYCQSRYLSFACAVLLPNLDVVIEYCFSCFFGWVETSISGLFVWSRNTIFFFVFWAIWPCPGRVSIRRQDRILAIAFGLIQGFVMVFSRVTAGILENFASKLKTQIEIRRQTGAK